MNVTLNGGDLGTIALGGFVKPFNDLVFYNAEKGKVYTVVTEFGVHIVEVLDWIYESNEEGVQSATVEVPIIPSDETQSARYDEMLDLVSDNRSLDELRTAIASNPDLNMQSSSPLMQNDFNIAVLGSGQTSRDIVRWAFDPSVEVGDVSPEVFVYQHPTLYYNNRYVITGLRSIVAAGVPDLDDVRATIEGLVKNQKKGALLKQELMDQRDLNKVAEIYSTTVDTARGVNFLTDFIANLGEEPKVASAAQKVPLNEVSEPIVGVRGVYMIKPFNRTEPNQPNVPSLRQSFTSQMASQAKAGMMQSLRENADIEDSRYNYY
jgi:parvulin-like peptidyl-prolyl isomerase